MIGLLPLIEKLKVWLPVLAVLLLIAWVKGSLLPAEYTRGYNAATAKISTELAKAAEKQALVNHVTSLAYQEGKAEREEREKVRYVEVQKIVRQPVYRNVCLDDDGLRIINDSAEGR